jgi:hypothetical protein
LCESLKVVSVGAKEPELLRQLFDNGRIEIEGHYLNKDKISKQKRWYVDSKLDF